MTATSAGPGRQCRGDAGGGDARVGAMTAADPSGQRQPQRLGQALRCGRAMLLHQRQRGAEKQAGHTAQGDDDWRLGRAGGRRHAGIRQDHRRDHRVPATHPRLARPVRRGGRPGEFGGEAVLRRKFAREHAGRGGELRLLAVHLPQFQPPPGAFPGAAGRAARGLARVVQPGAAGAQFAVDRGQPALGRVGAAQLDQRLPGLVRLGVAGGEFRAGPLVRRIVGAGEIRATALPGTS